MAGLAPMMFGVSLDFIGGGYTVDRPDRTLVGSNSPLAVVFGLGVATLLTLVFTPSMLALGCGSKPVAYRSWATLSALSRGSGSRTARDLALRRAAGKVKGAEIVWDTGAEVRPARMSRSSLTCRCGRRE